MKWLQLALDTSVPIFSGNSPWIVALNINIAAVLVVQKQFDQVIETLTPIVNMPKADLGNLPAPSGTALFNLITRALLGLGEKDKAWEQADKSYRWSVSEFKYEKNPTVIRDERDWDVKGDEQDWDVLLRNSMTYDSADAWT